MEDGPTQANPLGDLTDDEILEIGAALELHRLTLLANVTAASDNLHQDRRRLRVAAVKLGINTALAGIGIAAAPITFGVSLLLSVGSICMLGWDGVEFVRHYAGDRTKRLAARRARDASAAIEAEFRSLVAEIERRSRQ